jgi:mevalonate pyrophosphate decarboxylase
MKNKVISVAFPTIPVIFVSSVRHDRVPLHDTMGLAVTDTKEETRSETTVHRLNENRVEFLLEGKPVDPRKQKDIEKVVRIFQAAAGSNHGVQMESRNYKIYSGSSDSGAAAIVIALNELYETDFSTEKLAELSMIISESGIRSVYGGMNATFIHPNVHGAQLASEHDMKEVKIFAMGFDYESRVSAEEIFQLTRSNPFYEYRLKMVPSWVAKIKLGLMKKDWNTVFSVAEENCNNAHYLIESSGRRCRRKEMMNAVIDVEEIRDEGLPVYWTAGGGKVINAITWEPHASAVFRELQKRGQKPIEYKVASGARVIRSE